MSIIAIAFVVIVLFCLRNSDKLYKKYSEVSLAEEKSASAQKGHQENQFSSSIERTGATL